MSAQKRLDHRFKFELLLRGRPERVQWQLWDMSGLHQHRPLWHLYAGQVDYDFKLDVLNLHLFKSTS